MRNVLQVSDQAWPIGSLPKAFIERLVRPGHATILPQHRPIVRIATQSFTPECRAKRGRGIFSSPAHGLAAPRCRERLGVKGCERQRAIGEADVAGALDA